jgi:hypothetical protein
MDAEPAERHLESRTFAPPVFNLQHLQSRDETHAQIRMSMSADILLVEEGMRVVDLWIWRAGSLTFEWVVCRVCLGRSLALVLEGRHNPWPTDLDAGLGRCV